MEKRDLIIVGGGSGGFGAAYQALQQGTFRVTLIEKNPGLGGTSTFGGVNCWEPGVGGEGVHRQLAEYLMKRDAGFVGESYGCGVTPDTPWGRSGRSPDSYEETLVRADRTDLRRFHFEPEAMDAAMQQILHQVDTNHRLELLLQNELVAVTTDCGQIKSLTVQTPQGDRTFCPKLVIDCSAELVVARAAGCKVDVGEDAQSKYQEPSAPDHSQRILNGLTQVFRVTPDTSDYIEQIPACYTDVDLSAWLAYMQEVNGPLSCFNDYPNGDININMLPTMPGEAWLQLPHEQLKHICEARVYAYWNWVATAHNFTGYRICHLFPMLGIRESYRLVGKYVLTEKDLYDRYPVSLGKDHIVAFADHPADLHGRSNKKGGMTTFLKYGIPYECMLPNEVDNLLVACRGASFSHIAASSARLSRTMIALGEAAGAAACQCLEQNLAPENVVLHALRKRLQIV